MIRKVVEIDEARCNGCGLCVPSCAEGAIRIIDGKAKLIADNLCDGLGACLGDCPQDAIRIIEREADPFDEVAVEQLHRSQKIAADLGKVPAGGCPGSRVVQMQPRPEGNVPAGEPRSQLAQWPVQLSLVPPTAPFLQDADLLIAADCVPFAYARFHDDFLAGKSLVIGCPKLDDIHGYRRKLAEIFRSARIKSVTVARMEVPCCSGLTMAVREALADAGKNIPLREVTITIGGDIKGW